MTLRSMNAKVSPEISWQSQIDALKLMIEDLRRQIELRDARHANAIEHLRYKFETEMSIRERLAALEARSPK